MDEEANDSTTRHPQLALDTTLHWTCCTCLMSMVICLIVDAWVAVILSSIFCFKLFCVIELLHKLIPWFSKNNIILINTSPNQQFLNKLQMLKLVKLKVGKALLVSAFLMWVINASKLALKYGKKNYFKRWLIVIMSCSTICVCSCLTHQGKRHF
jgi:hypothetical protein